MIKEAINRILELSAPNLSEYQGETFTDKNLHRLPKCLKADTLKVHTLSAIVAYILEDVDHHKTSSEKFVIHVESFDQVNLYKELNADRERECLLSAKIDNCAFPFGRFLDLESFIINLQTNFISTEILTKILSITGNIVNDTAIVQEDDGVSQRVTVKNGISVIGRQSVPNPVLLQPYRTFTEIEQPESSFVLRMRKNADGSAAAALFASDGDAWKRDAINLIAEWWFEKVLTGRSDTIVLA